jgi:phosphoesterase RecJ-like protein
MKKYENFFLFLDNFKKIIITSHENPDGDAIGSEYAIFILLKKLGYNAVIMTCEEIPEKYNFINIGNHINVVSKDSIIDEDLSDAALLVLDTNTPTNTGNIYNLIKNIVKDIFIIDHHEIDERIFNKKRSIIDVNSSSTCEILYNIFKYCSIEIDFPAAQAIYAGIIYDTGSFIYPKTSSRTLKIASELVKKGVMPNIVYSNLYEMNSLSSLRLQSKVFSEIEFYHYNKIALQVMLKKTLEDFKANYEDGDSIINLPLKCKDILVSVFFKENYSSILRCSIRSKNNIDVVGIAKKYGGGGHTTAAGFKCNDSLEIVKEQVLKDIIQLLG